MQDHFFRRLYLVVIIVEDEAKSETGGGRIGLFVVGLSKVIFSGEYLLQGGVKARVIVSTFTTRRYLAVVRKVLDTVDTVAKYNLTARY